MWNKKLLLFSVWIYSLLCLKSSSAQDDLLKLLQSENPKKSEKIIATFKSDRIINIETNETVRKGNLDVRIGHLFGNVGAESGGGIHSLYGIDQSADIRLGFHYGISDRLTLGFAHLKRNENLEGIAKFRLLQQTSDGKIPFAITLFGNTTYSIRESDELSNDIYRLTYCTQAIFARKFSSKFSMAITPCFIHRNFVHDDDENNTFSLSAGFRLKFTPSASFIFDYSHTFNREKHEEAEALEGEELFDPAGFGVEIETGGHVFSIMFTNASGIIPNDYLLHTEDSWAKGGYKFSFIISRMFSFGREADKK